MDGARAAQDLYSITRYIRRDNPTAARSVAKTIYDGCQSLIDCPHRAQGETDWHARIGVFSVAVHSEPALTGLRLSRPFYGGPLSKP